MHLAHSRESLAPRQGGPQSLWRRPAKAVAEAGEDGGGGRVLGLADDLHGRCRASVGGRREAG
jgi:hypothetical protein